MPALHGWRSVLGHRHKRQTDNSMEKQQGKHRDKRARIHSSSPWELSSRVHQQQDIWGWPSENTAFFQQNFLSINHGQDWEIWQNWEKKGVFHDNQQVSDKFISFFCCLCSLWLNQSVTFSPGLPPSTWTVPSCGLQKLWGTFPSCDIIIQSPVMHWNHTMNSWLNCPYLLPSSLSTKRQPQLV